MREDESIGFMISNIGRKLSQKLTLRFQAYDITSEQWSVLNKLTLKDGISQRELSERSEKDPANVTRILDQLERKGCIRRENNPEDRRSFLIFVTENGKKLNEQLAPQEQLFVQAMTSSLSETEEAVLRNTLLKINDAVDAS
ncbi:MarR family winged helix-turn-helix transcriptional regulator [Paenibacillus abyssi]|uniref:MarR family transcriptional regulator n=1 Tax=Paenibacillus abyssi TaxID=1340531 RepID=A0A917G2Q5_9BACL|nr:MarR family transcriptional regulator [Paenibacillus abyssi]GGG19375.1 MarR family transcriptional regulator [Paenibacillus abyssi]